MKSNLSCIKIRKATESDNVGLLTLTSQSPMQGIISLRIDRYPNFFSLLNERGNSTVFVATSGDEIIGSFSTSIKNVWLGGEKTSVHYLADLKVLSAYRANQVAFTLVKKMYSYIQSQEADILYCTTAKGNENVEPLFHGRLGMPAFIRLGNFSVSQIFPTSRKIRKKSSLEITEQLPDSFQLHQFYNKFYKSYQLAPVVDEFDFLKTTNIMAIQNGKVKAAMSLLNINSFKQNVVVDMSFFLKSLVTISKITSGFFGVLRLPSIGEPIRTLHIKYFACEDNHFLALRYLLQRARNIGWRDGFHFISLGLHDKDPYRSLLKGVPNINFTSSVLVTSLQRNEEKIKNLVNGILYEDFSLS